ncbi:MAG: hypothetical protein K2H93_01735 [Oscillospiraceae bacterium]|nr:hypothetical protein [Oscillospiraceae bacterium]
MKKYLFCILVILSCLFMNSCGILYGLSTVNYEKQFVMQKKSAPELLVTCDLSSSKEKQVSKVTLEGELINIGNTSVTNIYSVNVLHTGVVGRFGCPVEIKADKSLFTKNAKIIFYYDSDNLNQIPEENLILLHYDEEECFYNTIESKLDTALHTVCADISEAGVYLLADAYQWYDAWGIDVSGFAHDMIYQNSEFCFAITIPKDIQIQEISGQLQDDEEGKCQKLLESKKDSTMQIGIEYLERPNYVSIIAFMDTLAGIMDKNGYLQKTDEIESELITGYYFYSKYDEENYSISCAYPITNTSCIYIYYAFKNENDFQKAMQSLESFSFSRLP